MVGRFVAGRKAGRGSKLGLTPETVIHGVCRPQKLRALQQVPQPLEYFLFSNYFRWLEFIAHLVAYYSSAI